MRLAAGVGKAKGEVGDLSAAGGLFSPRRLGAKEVAAMLTFRVAGPMDDGTMKDIGARGGAGIWLLNQVVPWCVALRGETGARGAFGAGGGVALVFL